MRSSMGEKILASKTGKIYEKVLDNIKEYSLPSKFVAEGYSWYIDNNKSNPSTNGRIFEYLICETLLRAGISPIYYQAKFTLIPNADFDIVFYNPKKPVVLSAKTSLRERYKQAALEGYALLQVYRNAEIYLLTLSDEYHGVQQKIQAGDVDGLTACLRANTKTYDTLLDVLKEREFFEPEAIIPLTGQPLSSE